VGEADTEANMDFDPQPPPQPYGDSDRINAAFDNLGDDAYGGYTNDGMDEYDGMNGNHDDEQDEQEYEEDHFADVAVVQDYTTEFPEEEAEGWAYNAEKRHIRETVELGDSFLFMWGEGSHGKLGQNSLDNLNVPFIVASTIKIPIRMCALGKDHTVLLAVEGYALACGSNAYGQLGTGDQADSRMNFTLVQGATEIKAIAAGHYHNLALTNSGKVLAWGGGSWGKLGLSSDSNVKSPRSIASLQSSTVEFIACGAHHSTAITLSGDVWTWGKGLRGQLGHNTVKEEYNPRICALLRKAGADRIR
jgi:alpha-tubulin suppressor-like RCC1 family protein